MKTKITSLLPFLKKKTVEPVVYSILLADKDKPIGGAQLLYLGIHYSWDDAYAAARLEAKGNDTFKGKDISWGPKLWTGTPVREIINEFCDVEIDTSKGVGEVLNDTLQKIEEIKGQDN